MKITIPFINAEVDIPVTQILVNLVYTFIIIIAGKVIIKVIGHVIERIDAIAEKRGIKRLDISEHGKFILKTIARYFIWFFVIMGILYLWGLKDIVAATLTSAGVAGIVIGFAAKDVFSNLISGILLAFDKPFRIGDAISVGGNGGIVRKISLRSTTLTSFDGVPLTIPNSILSNQVITNYSRSRKRKLDIKVNVAFKTNLSKAIQYLQKELKNKKWILQEPAPVVYVENFGESGVDLIARVWIAPKDFLDKKTKFYKLVKKTLDRHRIEITLPHRIMIQRKK